MKERPSIVKSNGNVNDFLRMPNTIIFALKSTRLPLNFAVKCVWATRYPVHLHPLFFYRVIFEFPEGH